MAGTLPKLKLSPSRDIPLDRLALSPSNVRRIASDAPIGELAADIARRGLLQSLNVRPILDCEGQETGRFEIPAGGRRFRALELLVKQKRLAKNAPIPCIVRSGADILAEDDSLAENAQRVNLHPLDQFRGMQALVDKDQAIEDIAAHFFVTTAVVRQRLKLASVSPKLLDIYGADGMSLELLMAFTVYDEGHQFDGLTRGPTYELLLTSLKLTLPEATQVILISAVIGNANALAEWLVGDPEAVIDGAGLLPTSKSIAFARVRTH